MFHLKSNSCGAWVEAVLKDFDAFLLDHASCEKKASGMAMTFVSHYPDREALVVAMTDLAIEELNHFKEVQKLIHARGLQLAADQKDEYVGQLLRLQRKGSLNYFMDRLILAGIIEARGQERFGLIAEMHPDPSLKRFYTAITRSEARHGDLFETLACTYFPAESVSARAETLLQAEAKILAELEIRAALH